MPETAGEATSGNEHHRLGVSGTMGSMADEGDTVPIKIVWPSDATRNAEVITHAALLWDAESSRQGVYLLLGHLGPPTWFSPDEAQRVIEEHEGQFPIDLRGSYFLTRARATEIWETLGRHLKKAGLDEQD